MSLLALVFLAACALSSCAGSDGGGLDVTLGDALDVVAGCLPDGDDTPAAAHALMPDTPFEGLVCPIGDRDWVRVEGVSAGDLVSVTLERDAGVGAVDLRYTVYAADGATPIGSGSDPNGADGPTRLSGAHRVTHAGAVYVEVRDEGNDDQDRFGIYRLTVAIVPDPDPNEPNDDTDHATPLPDGEPVQGALAARGDRDVYRVTVPSGAPRRISVAVSEEAAAATELEVVLLGPDRAEGGGTKADLVEIGRVAAPYDDDAPAGVAVTWAASGGGGDHHIVIADRDGDELDLTARYTVRATLTDDPDPLEAGGGNDTPATATPLADGGERRGLSIAARADQDWFVLEAPANAAPGAPALLDLVVAPEAGALDVELTVALFAPDAGTPCEPGDACDILAATSEAGCTRDAECPSHVCRDDGWCAGGGFCLPGGCAVPRWLRAVSPPDDSPGETAGDGVRAVLPLVQPGPHWVVVRDRQDQGWDDARTYRVAVSLATDPPANEPDGAWLPGADETLDRESWPVAARLATPVPYTVTYEDGTVVVGPPGAESPTPPDADAGPATTADTITDTITDTVTDTDTVTVTDTVTDTITDTVTGTDADAAADTGADAGTPLPPPDEITRVEFDEQQGWISFEADEDWYRLEVPEAVTTPEGAAWLRIDWRVAVDYAYAGDRLQPFWTLFRGESPRIHASWTTPPLPASGTLGDGQGDLDGDGAVDCLYLCHLVERPLWLRVTDFGRTRTDRETPYSFRVVLSPECPEECDCARNCPE